LDSLLIENLMQIEEDRHLEENVVESYAMGSLRGDSAAQVEMHLMGCETCRDRVSAADAYVHAMKTAAPRLPAESKWSHFTFRILFPAMALGALLITAVAIRLAPLGRNQPAVTIQLLATRGTDAQARGPARRVLLLQPDLSGLPASQAFRIEMVNNFGLIVWRGTLAAQPQPAGSLVPAQPRGVYFVRVFMPSGELLREYALDLRSRD
jgi:hypothetical protein